MSNNKVDVYCLVCILALPKFLLPSSNVNYLYLQCKINPWNGETLSLFSEISKKFIENVIIYLKISVVYSIWDRFYRLLNALSSVDDGLV